MSIDNPRSRREFLALSILPAMPGWFPWFHSKELTVAGARFQVIHNGRSRRRYLLIHGDEETARQVLEKHMETHKGVAFLIEGHTREIEINGGKLDPNRMFSRVGAEASLKDLNPGWTPEQLTAALDLLDVEREKLLDAVLPPDGGLLMALHNNTEYAIGAEHPFSEQTSLKEPDQPHAFFLVTDPHDYETLAASPFNVVLEQYVRGVDDGSLSRRAAARGRRYLNLESPAGDAARQQQMLDWAEEHLPEYLG